MNYQFAFEDWQGLTPRAQGYISMIQPDGPLKYYNIDPYPEGSDESSEWREGQRIAQEENDDKKEHLKVLMEIME